MTGNRRVIGRPFKKGQGGRPKGATNLKTRDLNLLTRMQPFVDGDVYTDNLQQRMLRGRAAHMDLYFARRLHGQDAPDTPDLERKPVKIVIEVVRER